MANVNERYYQRRIERPTIYIVGNVLTGDHSRSYANFVDNTIDTGDNIYFNVITSSDVLNEDDLPMFDVTKNVRIIITPDSTYSTYGYPAIEEDSTKVFIGKVAPVNNIVNEYAETYYTMNGKDPSRTRSYLYRYLNLNDRTNHHTHSPNPSDPSTSGSQVISVDNLNSLGFLLKPNRTGGDTYDLRARTYYRGKKSDVSIAKFRVVDPEQRRKTIFNSY